MEDGKILISESDLGKLFAYWEEWSGKRFLHIRYWYCDKKDGVLKPGKKGIAVPEHKINDVLGALKILLAPPEAESVYGG